MRRNILQIVTPLAAGILYTGMSIPVYGGSMTGTDTSDLYRPDFWTPEQRAQQKKDAINELIRMDSRSLEEVRAGCADGDAYDVKRHQEQVLFNGFPEVHEICRAAMDAAGGRDLSFDLYASLALQDLYGIRQADNALEFKLAEAPAVELLQRVLAAAAAGEKSYPGFTNAERLSYIENVPSSPHRDAFQGRVEGRIEAGNLAQKTHPLRPELAFDAGHLFGQVRPDLMPTLGDPEAAEAAARACFSEVPRETISVEGVEQPATRACAMVGGHFGKRLKLTDAAPLPPERPDVPAGHGALEEPAGSSATAQLRRPARTTQR